MRRPLIVAALAGLVLAPVTSRVAHAICAPRLTPDWMSILPFVIVGLLLGFTIASIRRRRRSGSPFVIMRGRVQCPECEYLLDLDDRHCARCGAAVMQIKRREPCPKCRARNWEDDDFCRQCGTSRVAGEAEGEAKT